MLRSLVVFGVLIIAACGSSSDDDASGANANDGSGPDGKRRLALWATTQGTSEAASSSISIPPMTGFDVYVWDGAPSSAVSENGTATFSLTGSPVLPSSTDPREGTLS